MVVGNKPSEFRTISRVSTSTKATVPSRKSNYQGQDSNLHAFRHQILSLARLPIPPPWHYKLIQTSTKLSTICKGSWSWRFQSKQVWTRQTYKSVANRAATDFEETYCERL